jgi:hypothetical protein
MSAMDSGEIRPDSPLLIPFHAVAAAVAQQVSILQSK